jgi:dienelactone hydrolase
VRSLASAAPAEGAILAAPGRLAIRATLLTTLLLGAVAEPRLASGQDQPAPPYRIVRPQGNGPHPALLFVSGCSGFAPHEAPHAYGREADEYAARGFVVLFVDYLGARGFQVCGRRITPSDIAPDILAAAEHARTLPYVLASDISVIGWSMGGGGALAAIGELLGDRPAPFQRAVAYYPACWTIRTPWRSKVPLLMLLAGRDEVSSNSACTELLKRVGEGHPIEVRVYPEARHAFNVPELPPLLQRPGGPIGYDPDAAAAALAEVKRFLGR